MVNIKPKQPSSNTLQKKEVDLNTNPTIPIEGIVTKKIMEYDEYEQVEGTEYIVVQGEKVPKRISVDNLFGYDNDVSKIIVDGIEYEPNEDGIIDISDVRQGLSTEDHEHEEYALVDHKHDEYITEHVDLSNYATKEDLKTRAYKDHEHDNYALLEHYHDQYLTEHQDLSDYATKKDLEATEAKFDSKIDMHNHDDEYAPLDHEHEDYLEGQQRLEDSLNNYATKELLNNRVLVLDAKYEELKNHTHEEYSSVDHNHDEDYAFKRHEHKCYALECHNHDERYALDCHDHDDVYVNIEYIKTLEETVKRLQDTIEAMPKFSFNENNELVVKIGDSIQIFKPR